MHCTNQLMDYHDHRLLHRCYQLMNTITLKLGSNPNLDLMKLSLIIKSPEHYVTEHFQFYNEQIPWRKNTKIKVNRVYTF